VEQGGQHPDGIADLSRCLCPRLRFSESSNKPILKIWIGEPGMAVPVSRLTHHVGRDLRSDTFLRR
jgi:hypothetical protein